MLMHDLSLPKIIHSLTRTLHAHIFFEQKFRKHVSSHLEGNSDKNKQSLDLDEGNPSSKFPIKNQEFENELIFIPEDFFGSMY